MEGNLETNRPRNGVQEGGERVRGTKEARDKDTFRQIKSEATTLPKNGENGEDPRQSHRVIAEGHRYVVEKSATDVASG